MSDLQNFASVTSLQPVLRTIDGRLEGGNQTNFGD